MKGIRATVDRNSQAKDEYTTVVWRADGVLGRLPA